MTLDAPEHNGLWTANAIQNAQGMLDGTSPRKTAKWDGTAAHVGRVRKALQEEQERCKEKLGEEGLAEYKQRVEEAETKKAPAKAPKLKGRKGQAVSTAEEERLHPRQAKGRKGGGQFIEKGDNGKVVSRIQGALGVEKSGTYDDKTKEAVEDLQRELGLAVDGVVGNQTAKALIGQGADGKVGKLTDERWKALRTAQLAVKKSKKDDSKSSSKSDSKSSTGDSSTSSGAESSDGASESGTSSSEAGTSSDGSATSSTQDKGLSSGDSGSKVRELQQALGIPVTGTFNRRTERRVRRYQKENGLPVTGRVSPKLLTRLKQDKKERSRPAVKTAKAVQGQGTNQKTRASTGKGTVESSRKAPARRAVAGAAVTEAAVEEPKRIVVTPKPFDKVAALERRLAEAVEARKSATDSTRFAEARAREIFWRRRIEENRSNAQPRDRLGRWRRVLASPKNQPIEWHEIQQGDIIEFKPDTGSQRLKVEVRKILRKRDKFVAFTGMRIKGDGSQGGTHDYGANKRSAVTRLD